MRVRSIAWSEDPRFAHTKRMVEVCPQEFIPSCRQNMASGGLAVEWPDVCYCATNGGQLHALQSTCVTEESCNCKKEDEKESKWLTGHTEPSYHIDGCPFDVCPIAQCHPMCSQVTGDTQQNFCHCPCHG